MDKYTFRPIGIVHCDAVYTQETPRQGSFSRRTAVIELAPEYINALKDISGVSHIWIIWVFDRVKGWKSTVHPPTADFGVGVFATRSPHRPNPIGITAAKLVKAEQTKLYVENIDLLDGTPVLDIKPYITEADSVPDAVVGWKEQENFAIKEFSVLDAAQEKAQFVRENSKLDLLETSRVQLATRMLDPSRQRLTMNGNSGILAFRTWRIHFTFDGKSVTVTDIASGYTAQELAPDAPDKYGDHDLHRRFREKYIQ